MSLTACILSLVPSSTPQNITIENTSSQSFTINWQPPDDEYQNGIIIKYSVIVVDIDLGSVTQLNVTGTDITVSNLKPFMRYEVMVAAHTTAGRGPFSATQVVQTQEAGMGLQN